MGRKWTSSRQTQQQAVRKGTCWHGALRAFPAAMVLFATRATGAMPQGCDERDKASRLVPIDSRRATQFPRGHEPRGVQPGPVGWRRGDDQRLTSLFVQRRWWTGVAEGASMGALSHPSFNRGQGPLLDRTCSCFKRPPRPPAPKAAPAPEHPVHQPSAISNVCLSSAWPVASNYSFPLPAHPFTFFLLADVFLPAAPSSGKRLCAIVLHSDPGEQLSVTLLQRPARRGLVRRTASPWGRRRYPRCECDWRAMTLQPADRIPLARGSTLR